MNSELIIRLKSIFDRKKKENPAYSLRALARDMGLSQPVVSLYLRGQIRLTPSMAYAIGKYLKMNDEELLKLIVSTL